jgi:hypothetical protein
MKYIIARTRNYISSHKREIVLIIIVFLLMLFSFIMGYLIAKENNQVPPIIIQKFSQ